VRWFILLPKSLMEQHEFPGLFSHRAQHEEFRKRLAEYLEAHKAGKPDARFSTRAMCADPTSMHVCRSYRHSAIVLCMFADFTATDRWTKKQVHCVYQAMIVAIATRHADAVDIKFLVDGRTVWAALPHPAWVEYKKRTGKAITDSLAVEIAGHYLKTALESGEGLGREMYSLTVEETLAHLEAGIAEMQAQPA
jgi:hypothetical protein